MKEFKKTIIMECIIISFLIVLSIGLIPLIVGVILDSPWYLLLFFISIPLATLAFIPVKRLIDYYELHF